MKGSLPWKLTGIFCLAIIFGLVLGYFFLSAHMKAYFNQDLQRNLKRELVLCTGFIEDWLDSGRPFDDPYALAVRMGTAMDVRVTIVAADGVVLGDSSLTRDEVKNIENHAARPEIQAAFQSGFGVNLRFSNTLEKHLLYAAMSFGQGQNRGVLRFAMPLKDIRLFEAGLDKVVVMALCFVFLISLGFTYLMSVFVAYPLREMASIAKDIAKGNFSKIPQFHSQDEVGDLAKAITNMSYQIRSKINDVEGEKAKMDAVLASIFEGLMVVDVKGVVVLMNPSLRKMLLLDVPPEGRRAVEIIRNSIVIEMVNKLLSGKDHFVSEDVFIGFSEEKMLKVNGVTIRVSDRLEGAVLVFHDISELRRLEKVRQDFVANVSHELRTPVASIKGYAETLLDGALADPGRAHEFVTVIKDNSELLVNLINDLLDLAKIESGRIPLLVRSIELGPVVNRIYSVLEKTIAMKSLRVRNTVAADFAKVNADEGRLSQVLLNLLDNAIKYTPDGGSVFVRARQEGAYVCIEIEDTGIGIPEKDLSRIFERFYRVDKARSRELGGTGLGLSIVKHIVQSHGGDVWVTSVLGQGTIVSFTLPSA